MAHSAFTMRHCRFSALVSFPPAVNDTRTWTKNHHFENKNRRKSCWTNKHHLKIMRFQKKCCLISCPNIRFNHRPTSIHAVPAQGLTKGCQPSTFFNVVPNQQVNDGDKLCLRLWEQPCFTVPDWAFPILPHRQKNFDVVLKLFFCAWHDEVEKKQNHFYHNIDKPTMDCTSPKSHAKTSSNLTVR